MEIQTVVAETPEEKKKRQDALSKGYSETIQGNAKILKDDLAERRKDQEEKIRLEKEKNAKLVEAGITTITSGSSSVAEAENEIKSEGLPLGNPEDRLAKEKRTDWDPIKG